MKKRTRKLALRSQTLRDLSAVVGGALTAEPLSETKLCPHPSNPIICGPTHYGCPSNGTVSCLPPKTEG